MLVPPNLLTQGTPLFLRQICNFIQGASWAKLDFEIWGAYSEIGNFCVNGVNGLNNEFIH